MKLRNEMNGLELHNEKGTVYVERTPELGTVITVHNPLIALTMTGLYQKEELRYIVNNPTYARIKHGYFSPSIGSKKVLETIFTSEGIHGESEYAITFLSEDTTYYYPLKRTEWTELMALFAYFAA